MSKLDYRALALLVLGLAQMIGAVIGLAPLKGLAAATTASPAPKVFSSVKGLETYSTDFRLAWETVDGQTEVLALTPEIYPRLQGPYNRRNIYGAILAFGPVLYTEDLTRPMYDDIAAYAMCGDAPIMRELGVDPASIDGGLRVEYEPRPGLDLGDLPTTIVLECP